MLLVPLLAAGQLLAAFQGVAPGATLYAPDPAHPWNRVHEALARREAPDGSVLGLDEPDLLLWPDSDHLLEPAREAELVDALDAFVRADASRWIDATLARVWMQHELWTAFDWSVAERSDLDAGERARREAITHALVPALARVAPSAAALAELPDVLAATVARRDVARAPDPEHPEATFLPDVEWVLLGDLRGQGEPLAIAHAATFAGRSQFEVRLALPGGRAATEAWLEELAARGDPVVECDGTRLCFPDGRAGERHLHLDPDVLEPPPGAVVALVRRLLAFDDAGELHVTPIVATVQLRAFLPMPEDALRSDPLARPPGWPWQASAEWRLDPARLLTGEAAALRPLAADEPAFVFLGAHGDGVQWLERDSGAARPAALDACVSCHGIPGTLSLNSLTGGAGGPGTQLPTPLFRLPRRLAAATPEAIELRALRLKSGRADWGLLRGALDASHARER